jgi:hypothetical protein
MWKATKLREGGGCAYDGRARYLQTCLATVSSASSRPSHVLTTVTSASHGDRMVSRDNTRESGSDATTEAVGFCGWQRHAKASPAPSGFSQPSRALEAFTSRGPAHVLQMMFANRLFLMRCLGRSSTRAWLPEELPHCCELNSGSVAESSAEWPRRSVRQSYLQ